MITRHFRLKLGNMLMQTLFNRFSVPYVTFAKEFMDIRFRLAENIEDFWLDRAFINSLNSKNQ